LPISVWPGKAFVFPENGKREELRVDPLPPEKGSSRPSLRPKGGRGKGDICPRGKRRGIALAYGATTPPVAKRKPDLLSDEKGRKGSSPRHESQGGRGPLSYQAEKKLLSHHHRKSPKKGKKEEVPSGRDTMALFGIV